MLALILQQQCEMSLRKIAKHRICCSMKNSLVIYKPRSGKIVWNAQTAQAMKCLPIPKTFFSPWKA